MLPAVKALGDYVCKSERLSVESMLIEASKLDKVNNVLCIDFKYKDGKATYNGIFSENFNRHESTKYLYRVFSHRKFDVTPTSRVTNPEKLKKRFQLWFKQCREEYLQDPFLSALKIEFLSNLDRIFNDFSEKYNLLTKEERGNTIVTITIDSEKHIGDFEIFRKILKNEACTGLYAKHKVESKGKGKCYLCGEEKEVLGFASPFPVYTLDQRGFAPNFLQIESWKRLPLCMDCAIVSSAGKEFLNRYFYKGFYGINFYVIPKFVRGFNSEALEEIKNAEKKYWKIVGNEDDVCELLSNNEQITLTFVFTKPEKATFRIMRYVEDVSPSWIKKIRQTLEGLIIPPELNLWPIFREHFLKMIFGEPDLVGNFIEHDTSLGGLIRPFFPHSKYEGVYDKYFVDLVGDILAQREIRSRLLIDAFTKALRSSFIRGHNRNTKELALKSLLLVLLTRKLEILHDWGEESMQPIATGNYDQMFSFFDQYQTAFNSASKQAIFLEGVLARFLIDIQYANRKSTPFRDRLYGLKIDEKRAKKLFPEIIEKLREYKAAYTSLEEATSKAFVEAENKGWNLTSDEVSYFFTLGMTLAPVFKTKEGGKE
jgi:CRISPR-associated protein Csh1